MKSATRRFFSLSPITHVLAGGGALLLLTGVLPVLGQGAPMAKPHDMKSEAGRAAAVAELRARANNEKEVAERVARTRGWEIRGKDAQGRTFELMRLDETGRPLYYTTANANAAISTGANLIRNTAPYLLNGAGFRVGVWDVGSILTSHQEFIGRVFVMDGSSPDQHSTHVGGTIGAAGVDPNAQGMAPAVRLDSYDWNQDLAEMTQAAATTTNHAGKVLVSNHSYSTISGWSEYNPPNPPSYNGVYPQREDARFGQYGADAASIDQICADAPYYLPFRSAGNDRDQNAPSVGETFRYLTQTGWVEKTYDPAVDPLPDGWDNGGFDTMGTPACAKNSVAVGAVNDAVTNGVRSVVNGTMSSFSCWGPTDDGRIKPDLVANGVDLYSPVNIATNAYAIYHGTSMASPNAAGSAILLQQLYATNFGHVMRASTLKALLLHTANDLGNPGPDYAYGWGLLNAKAAADHILNPATRSIIEGRLDAGNATNTYNIHWAGGSPVRATICWTDPAGTEKTTLDDRTRVLVNDLDIRAEREAVTYYPYVLDVYNPANPATTGDNIADNVEQILITPASAGDYTVTVSHKGTLTGGEQRYALILSFGNATLTPHQPSGWSDKIVVSTGTGTSTDSAMLLPTDPLYVDFSILNNGVAAIAAGWSAELYVDGILKTNVSGGFLSAGGFQSWNDLNIGSLPSGIHTLRIQAFAGGMVPESNNEYSKTILVLGANDNFASAQTLFGDSGTVVGGNGGTTKEPGEPDHAGYPGGRSVWYHWTVPISGRVTIDTFFSTFNTLLGVYTGNTVNALTLVASNNDHLPTISQSRVTFSAVAGTSLWIAVDGFGGASGNITLNYSVVTVPPLTPVATTLPATSVTATNATLNGTVNPNGLATTAYFQYGLTTNYGSVTPNVLSPNSALVFNGTDQFATTSSNVDLANRSFSVEFWARRDGSNRWDMPLTQGTAAGYHGLHVGFRPGNTFAFAFWDDDLDASDDYSDNVWHHWACTYNQTNNQRFIYRDGVLVAADTAGGPYLENSPLVIARSAQLNANFGGALDELRVWSGVRTPAQINAGLNTTVAGTEPDLLAYWRFDEGTGASAGDSSGHANPAALIGSPSWTAGITLPMPPGTALVFNGTNQFATTSGNVNLANRSFSVEFWARRDGVNRWDTPLSQGTSTGSHGLQAGFRPNNRFSFAFWGDDLDAHSSYSDNAWHHWACTYNLTNNQRFIYRDGVVVAFDTADGPYLENSPLRIARFAQIDTYFAGALDELRVWNGVRTPAQINAGLNTTVAGTEPDLLAYWHFDEGTGVSAGDSSGHANTATLIGSPAWITGITVAALPVDASLAALTPGALYHFRLAASTSAGTYFGNDLMFTATSFFALVVTVNSDVANPIGEVSLRSAIALAANNSTIIFSNNLSGATILLTNGPLVLNKNLTIDASALPGGIKINGNQAGAVFWVDNGNVVLTALTITNGNGLNGLGGGGIYNKANLTVNQCTLVGNSTPGFGGGILNDGGILVVNGSTLTGNSCTSDGGAGIDVEGGLVFVDQSTLTLNNAPNSEGSGGIFIYSGSVTVFNSIVAGNTSPSHPNTSGSLSLTGSNLTSGNPLLASLANYGGPTPTMPPLPGSPAVDTASATSFVTDQRGFVRPLGLAPDIGAVEGIYNPAGPGTLTSATRLANGSFWFAFTNYTDASYTVLASTNVAAALNTWSNLGPAVESPLGSGLFSFTDPQATNNAQRYYRVKSP